MSTVATWNRLTNRYGRPWTTAIARSISLGFRPNMDSQIANLAIESTRVMLAATEHDPFMPDRLKGGPFEGCTRASLRADRQRLCGYPVRYLTRGRVANGGWALGIFLTITMPLEWAWGIFSSPYDLEIATNWDKDLRSCGSGTKHVMSLDQVLGFEVVDRAPWDVCRQCGSWRPPEDLVPQFTYFESYEDRDMNGDAKVCRECLEHEW